MIIAVAIFHFVYSWNDFFGPLIYLVDEARAPAARGRPRVVQRDPPPQPGLIQAGTIMTMVIPVILFLIFQRFFTRGIVITGVEK